MPSPVPTLESVRRWLASEGSVCSLQADADERRLLTVLVRHGRAASTRSTCGHLPCRHYRPTDPPAPEAPVSTDSTPTPAHRPGDAFRSPLDEGYPAEPTTREQVDAATWAPTHSHVRYPHEGGCAACAAERVCNVCGNSTKGDPNRCTNGRCFSCHGAHCGKGGTDGPGHGYGDVNPRREAPGTCGAAKAFAGGRTLACNLPPHGDEPHSAPNGGGRIVWREERAGPKCTAGVGPFGSSGRPCTTFLTDGACLHVRPPGFLVHGKDGATFPAATVLDVARTLARLGKEDPEVTYMPRATRTDGAPLDEAEADAVARLCDNGLDDAGRPTPCDVDDADCSGAWLSGGNWHVCDECPEALARARAAEASVAPLGVDSPFLAGILAALTLTVPLREGYRYSVLDRGAGPLLTVLDARNDACTWVEHAPGDLGAFVAAVGGEPVLRPEPRTIVLPPIDLTVTTLTLSGRPVALPRGGVDLGAFGDPLAASGHVLAARHGFARTKYAGEWQAEGVRGIVIVRDRNAEDKPARPYARIFSSIPGERPLQDRPADTLEACFIEGARWLTEEVTRG